MYSTLTALWSQVGGSVELLERRSKDRQASAAKYDPHDEPSRLNIGIKLFVCRARSRMTSAERLLMHVVVLPRAYHRASGNNGRGSLLEVEKAKREVIVSPMRQSRYDELVRL
jgi:hypothetical protein